MLKIVLDHSPSGSAVLSLEGQVIGPWVRELERACRPILASESRLELDLRGVSYLSQEGVRLLWTLRDREVGLLHCSAFIAEQLKSRGEAPA